MECPFAESIVRYFSADPNVVSVHLFGSQATGSAKPSSDVDLALLLDKKPEFDYRLKVMSDLADLLQKPVDVVLLDQCGLLMQRQVLKHGILVFERDSRKRKNFELLSRKMYLDFLPWHRRYVTKMEERILRRAENG